MSIIIETFTAWNKTQGISPWTPGSDIYGQTFKAPSASLALDKSTFYIREQVGNTSTFTFSAALYEFNTSTRKVIGSPLATGGGQFTSGANFAPVTVDFADAELDPAKTYIVYYLRKL